MMDCFEFARKYLQPYKVHNGEIIPQKCPYCNGGQHGDKETFALNYEKETYKCLRGKCGKQGHFSELCKDFGEQYKRVDEIYTPRQKKFVKPDIKTKELTQKAIDYAAKRKISLETLKKWKVTEKDCKYVFPYYDENNELVFVKYRPVGKIKEGEPKGLREKDGKPILWGMNMVDKSEPLIIVEGEFDALAVNESGVDNVVSVPSGSKDFSWVELCWDWLQEIKKIILFGDNDAPGQEMVRKLVLKLGEYRCYIVKHEYKDANELLFNKGKEAVKKAINEAVAVPKVGIIDVADIEPLEKKTNEGIPTGIKGLDRILEDTQLGELTIWTGKNGEGKSTMLGQIILEALDSNVNVFAYSGELTKYRFQEWINTQAAGEKNLITHVNKYGDQKSEVKKAVNDLIRAWYKGRFFLYDNSIRGKNIENTSIIDMCEYVANKYDCKLFVIDNLMTSDFEGNGDNYYQAQSKFVGDLVHFAKAYNVHVHLVAHPKKTDKDHLDKEAISGSGDITNRADNVIAIERIYKEDKEYDALLSLLKNRNTGRLGKFPLIFRETERRFYQLNKNGQYEAKIYGWERQNKGDAWEENAECPF